MRHPPHVRRVMKIIAHELLDRQHPHLARVLEILRQPQLLGPAQRIARFIGVKVHLVAHTQQKILRRHQPPMIEL